MASRHRDQSHSRARERRATRPLKGEPPPAADADGELLDDAEQPTAPRRRVRPEGSQSPTSATRAAPREQPAHMQARGHTARGSEGHHAHPTSGSAPKSKGSARAGEKKGTGKRKRTSGP